jgi:Ca2+-binding EF-hand superfamily protein
VRSWPAVGLLVALAGATLAQPDAPAPRPASPPGLAQELLFFTGDGPVRVRLTVTLDGKPAGEAWRAALDGLFAFCDRDANGTLDAKERELFRTGQRGQIDRFILVGGDVSSSFLSRQAVSFPEKDGKVDRDGFRDGFVLSGSGPVTVNPVLPRGDSVALTDALFKHLDRDADGKISLAELKAARDHLGPLDVDEDEIVTGTELQERTQNQNQFARVQSLYLGLADRRPAPAQIEDLFTPPAGQPVTVKDLLAARDRDKDGALSAAELGCGPKALAERDEDADGRLDADELAAWLRQPPDLDLKVNLSERAVADGSWNTLFGGGPAAAPVQSDKQGRLAGRVKPEWAGGLRLDQPDARFRFAAEPATPSADQWAGAEFALRSALDQVPGAGPELPRKKVADDQGLTYTLGLFDFADRNADGKLTKAELDAAAAVYNRLRGCRAVVTVTDRGRGLFELIDRDGDGRLSPRELNAAPEVLAALDRDGDGRLARAELPRGYTVSAQSAAVDAMPAGGVVYDANVVVLAEYVGQPEVSRQSPPGAPEWFRQMDRNGDGDVSAREFAGPTAVFRRIDADGDGLLSADEAVRFERANPKGK